MVDFDDGPGIMRSIPAVLPQHPWLPVVGWCHYLYSTWPATKHSIHRHPSHPHHQSTLLGGILWTWSIIIRAGNVPVPSQPPWWAFSKCCGSDAVTATLKIYISIIYTYCIPSVTLHLFCSGAYSTSSLSTIHSQDHINETAKIWRPFKMCVYTLMLIKWWEWVYNLFLLNPPTPFFYSMVLFKSRSISVLFKPWGDIERTHLNGWNNRNGISGHKVEFRASDSTLGQEERVGNTIRNVQIFSQDSWLRGF